MTDGMTLEQALIAELLPEEHAKSVIAWPLKGIFPEVYFFRPKGWPSKGTARVFHGILWTDSLGIVHPEEPPRLSNAVPKEGWVLTISERAVTPITDFATILQKLQEPEVRNALGLPLVEL